MAAKTLPAVQRVGSSCTCHRRISGNAEHVSGSGKWIGLAERARKPDERERDLKNYGGAERAESAAHNPFKPKLLIDIVSYHTSAFCSQFRIRTRSSNIRQMHII